MNPVATTILGAVSLLLSGWFAYVALKPRRWRMRWLDLFGTLDADTARPEKRRQESRLRVMAVCLVFLLVCSAASCGFWTWSAIHESKRLRSAEELKAQLLQEEIKTRAGRGER